MSRKGFLCFLLVYVWASFSCTQNMDFTNDSMKEFQELCSVTKNISEFDDKRVRVKALIRGFHYPLLYSEGCNGIENVILLDLNRESLKYLLDEIKNTNIDIKRSEITGEILLEGKIENNKGLIPDYEYDFQPIRPLSENKTIFEPKLLKVNKITSVNILSFSPTRKQSISN